MKRTLCLILPLLMIAMPECVPAREIAGVRLPATESIDGRTLKLNGAGVRAFQLAFVPIDIYVAALYSEEPLRSADAVMKSGHPLLMTFTFLRDVPKPKVRDAWLAQFRESNLSQYPGMQAEIERFASAFPALERGDVQEVYIDGDAVKMFQNGKPLGEIRGRSFRDVFLGLWFGGKPVARDLRTQLLGG